MIVTLACLLIAGVVWKLLKRNRARSYELSLLPMKLKIDAFTGFGTSRQFTVAGRVSQDGGRLSSLNAEFDRMGLATKLRRNLRRFLLPEMEGILLQIQVGEVVRETTSGARGFFKMKFLEDPLLSPGLSKYSVRIHDKEKSFEGIKSVGQIVIAPENSPYALISDIDDTIVTSHIKNKIRMVLHAIFTNVSDLVPTPGLASLYYAVQKGPLENQSNPVFYVSGSPLNLHDKINAFMRANRFPVGPIFLTKFGRGKEAEFSKQRIFKTEKIRELFQRFPKMKFVLIGDNTQYDSEIYQQIANEFPGRVATILIYARIPRIESRKILPMGQHLIENAMDAGLILYRKGIISKIGLQKVVDDLKIAEIMPESFKLERELKQKGEKLLGDRY